MIIKETYEKKKDPIFIQNACQSLPVSARARESIQKKHGKSADVNEELLQFISGFLGIGGDRYSQLRPMLRLQPVEQMTRYKLGLVPPGQNLFAL